MQEPLAYLNGEFRPASQASISVIDAGFVMGATVAEQLRTFGGQLFRVEEHLDRLFRSLEIVGIDPGLDRAQLAAVAAQLVSHNHAWLADGDDLGLAIFITPGPYATFTGGQPGRPTVGLHTYPLPFALWAEKYERGESLATTDFVQVSEQSWPAELKCRSRMHYYLADRQARQSHPGARALLLSEQGFVRETATANVLVYNEREGLLTPPREHVLPGISQAMVFELARSLGISCEERELLPSDLEVASEVMLASTPSCLLPVTSLNGSSISSGRPGAVFRRLLAAWSEATHVDIAGQARRFARRS
jgi:branched-chain amino acid aminotransferase